jgi:hypothetical protein
MSVLTVENLDVIEAHVVMPRIGAWVADLVLDSESALADGAEVTLSAADGIELKGTVLPGRSSVFVGANTARVVAGKAGLSKPASPRYYSGALFRDVLSGLMNDAGESLAMSADAGVLSAMLESWLVLRQPISRALTVLLERAAPTGTSWRVLADGALWIGAESWPTTSARFELLAQRGADATAELGVETITIMPGMIVPDVGKASHVEHWIGRDRIRTIVTCEDGGVRERVKGALMALARGAMPGIDYLGLYNAKVVSTDGGTVDVVPDDARLSNMSKVPVRWGLPGATVQLTPGDSYVQVGWDAGDPAKPFACAPKGAVMSITLETTQAITVKAASATVEGTQSVTVKAASATLEGTATVDVKAPSIAIGANASEVKLGPVGAIPLLVLGSMDSLGVPVSQFPGASGTVKGG